MKTLSKDINYAEMYLTFNCGLGCSYCINHAGDFVSRKEMPGKDWVSALNEIDFGDLPVTLGGGEPTKHPDFYDILKGIKPETRVDLLSNASFDVDEFLHRVSPKRFRSPTPAYKAIRISYHPERQDASELVKKVATLQAHGFPIGIFGLNHPLNMDANIKMAELARERQVYFFIKDFLGEYGGQTFGFYKYPKGLHPGKTKVAKCKSNELLVAPDGDIHKCHRDLYTGEFPIGHISKDLPEPQQRLCYSFGWCNPCDLKLKANRFLDMGKCAVEIDRMGEE